MTHRVVLHAALVLGACVTLSACGITGGTSRFVVPLDPGQVPTGTAEVRVASAGMDKDPAYLQAVHVVRWGKFDADDLRNLEESLRGTITRHRPVAAPAESRLDIHLVMRRYVLSASNTGAAALACVAWAATTPQGTLLFEEQFYASHLVGTLGLLKDEVHRAIVERIATTAFLLAADPAASRLPRAFPLTPTALDEAASRLPRTMVSMGVPGPRAIGLVGILVPNGILTVQWEVATPSEHFDWKGYLKKVYTAS
jgi:hypothetical protein